jgi:trimeric autotransporter adhesin
VKPALYLTTALTAATLAFAQPAQRAGQFVEGIGVNQHLNWSGTPYADANKEAQELAYLGVTLVRDAPPYGATMSDYRTLAGLGIRFNFVTTNAGADVAGTLQADLSGVVELLQAVPGSVVSVEGPNELNGQIVYLNGSPSSNPITGAEIVQTVSQGVRGNATLTAHGVKVVNVSITNGIGGWLEYVVGLGVLSPFVDHANWHTYFSGGAQPATNIASMFKDGAMSAPGKPVVFTETGYFTAYQDSSGWGGVDEQTQAKNTLNLLADAYKGGVVQTYLYELMDGAYNPSLTDIENTWGLFHADGTPKPAATAIRNLTYVLHDPAADALTFAPHALNYSISNMPMQGNSLLLEKSGGTFELLVWNEAPDWDPTTKSPITGKPTNTTVDLGQVFGSVKVFDPTQSSDPIQTMNGARSVAITLTDHVLIVEAGGSLTTLPNVGSAPTVTSAAGAPAAIASSPPAAPGSFSPAAAAPPVALPGAAVPPASTPASPALPPPALEAVQRVDPHAATEIATMQEEMAALQAQQASIEQQIVLQLAKLGITIDATAQPAPEVDQPDTPTKDVGK